MVVSGCVCEGKESGGQGGSLGHDALDLQVGIGVNQSAPLQIHHETEVMSPRMGLLTSAITKIHLKVRLSPRLRVRDLVPKVGMGVPLAALRERWSVASRLSSLEGGTTLTAAPVSTKLVSPLFLSVMCNTRL